jgi:hypothetical protein
LHPTIEKFSNFIEEIKNGGYSINNNNNLFELMKKDSIIDDTLIPDKNIKFEWNDSYSNPNNILLTGIVKFI